MDSITLQNYRCFGSEEQTARLAPLTLLVGPNSTGKTSFLALIRALWDVAFREVAPNFREEPYDLGSWDDIVHQPGGRSKLSESFACGFDERLFFSSGDDGIRYCVTFENWQTAPFPTVREYGYSDVAVKFLSVESRDGEHGQYRVGKCNWQDIGGKEMVMRQRSGLASLDSVSREHPRLFSSSKSDTEALQRFFNLMGAQTRYALRPFASAPLRANPLRTYDPSLLAYDAEGDYIPSYLANLSRRNADEWQLLKSRLEDFGKASELFNEIAVRSFGKSDGDPFQIQVRKFGERRNGRRRKGPWRNLIDVGYGVSQALPVLTELLRPDGPTMFLLQQPEVHLHPQAQAALGTLFCQVAAGGRQLIIETHSDYIIDRVRMDVRDGTTGLKPEDVSILYFEPGDLAVKIHSIRIDDAGNVKGAPEGYRQFFTDEMMRSIWV